MKIKDEKSKTGQDCEGRNDGHKKTTAPEEFGGRNGPEPTRYGDWEKDGIASDF